MIDVILPLIKLRPHGGNYRLRGTVLESGGEQPVADRLVQVFAEITKTRGGGRPVTLKQLESVKTQQNGTWEAAYLSPALSYTVIAFDPDGQYDPVMKAGLIPEPME